MDTFDEKIYKVYSKNRHYKWYGSLWQCNFLETGGFLSVLFNIGDMQADKWILEDFDTKTWKK